MLVTDFPQRSRSCSPDGTPAEATGAASPAWRSAGDAFATGGRRVREDAAAAEAIASVV